MKTRAELLGLFLATPLLLAVWMVSLPEGPKARLAQATAELASEDAATAARPKDPSGIGPAVFPHDEHVEDMEIECEECHHESGAAPLTFPHKDYFDDFWIDCKICHHESGAVALSPKGCSICHHSRNADTADETPSAKLVIHKNCWSCHEVGTGAEASAICTDCHTGGSGNE